MATRKIGSATPPARACSWLRAARRRRCRRPSRRLLRRAPCPGVGLGRLSGRGRAGPGGMPWSRTGCGRHHGRRTARRLPGTGPASAWTLGRATPFLRLRRRTIC